MSNPLRQVREALDQAANVLVVMHVHPDGDTTGSALALGQALSDRGKNVVLVCANPIDKRYDYLTQGRSILTWDDVRKDSFDVVVTVDCGDIRRTGNEEKTREAGRLLINIDHHASNPGFAHINWVDHTANATGVLIYQLLLNWQHPLSDFIATALYTSLSTDTGSFMYPWTSSEALAVASVLSREIADFGKVNQALWAQRTWTETALAGWALTHVKASPSRRVVWVALPYEVMHALHVSDSDADALIDWIRPIQTAEVAVVLREMDPGGSVKISWRSACFDVSQWAHHFGGGGHVYSSAAVVNLGLDAAEDAVLKRVAELVW